MKALALAAAALVIATAASAQSSWWQRHETERRLDTLERQFEAQRFDQFRQQLAPQIDDPPMPRYDAPRRDSFGVAPAPGGGFGTRRRSPLYR